MDNVSSLEWFQAFPNGESRLITSSALEQIDMKASIQFSFLLIVVAMIAFHDADANASDSEKPDSEAMPAKAIETMQGKWKVLNVWLPSLNHDDTFPKELRFTKQGSEIVIKGNSILSHGKLVATFANNLNLPQQKKELGLFPHLIMLTLPTGKGVLCSYELLSADRLRIAYTHKCVCNRTGTILTLERMTK
jgi:hypothetical protein